ncbi:hypothetical protein MOF28_20105 [Bacillus haynesii]|uniref:hypothetical protein n=1 Tax=Bacillus haynesii TaxID=1925021 RepID=UPI002282EAB5|nr:hypothetical protein [Bacillus haynesii]MCY9340634.1 hypothetical protein [Bacillus haynesii]
MAYGDLPKKILERLSSERTRMYHALWHFVRNKESWDELSTEQREELINQGWEPPRFENEPGAGIDFLYMHRQMIRMVNEWGASEDSHDHGGEHVHNSPDSVVSPWLDIPWNHNDPVWPMPNVSNPQPNIFGNSKEQATTDVYFQQVNDTFTNRSWLRTVSLDKLGSELEFGIHGWMHMHWSTEPPTNPNSLDQNNDWLGSPFSSHVNKHFWKLHGWIDNRITAWEDANGQKADLSQGWDGPLDYITNEPHNASPELFTVLNFDEQKPLLMPWKGLLLER